eukprot:356225-Chlamydomonas_euryale.AAC.18
MGPLNAITGVGVGCGQHTIWISEARSESAKNLGLPQVRRAPRLCSSSYRSKAGRGTHAMSPPEGLTGKTPSGDTLRVREVWANNLDSELEILRNAVESYPFCAMDTEFPGVVARLMSQASLRPGTSQVAPLLSVCPGPRKLYPPWG